MIDKSYTGTLLTVLFTQPHYFKEEKKMKLNLIKLL